MFVNNTLHQSITNHHAKLTTKQGNTAMFNQLSAALRAEKIDTATAPPYAKGTVQAIAHDLLVQAQCGAKKSMLMDELMLKMKRLP